MRVKRRVAPQARLRRVWHKTTLTCERFAFSFRVQLGVWSDEADLGQYGSIANRTHTGCSMGSTPVKNVPDRCTLGHVSFVMRSYTLLAELEMSKSHGDRFSMPTTPEKSLAGRGMAGYVRGAFGKASRSAESCHRRPSTKTEAFISVYLMLVPSGPSSQK